MRRIFFTALLLFATSAHADSGMLMAGVANRQMPLDPVAAPTACYGEIRLRTAYTAGLGIRIVRASDSAPSDIGFTAHGYPDTATETGFCAATTCKLVTQYDQCGSNNITQATDANRFTRAAGPATFNASQATAATQTHAGSAVAPATGVLAAAAVFIRTSGTGTCTYRVNGNNNRFLLRNAAAGGTLIGGTSGQIASGGAESVWHSYVGNITGDATSVLMADGVDGTAGTLVGNTTSAATAIFGGATTTCATVAQMFWDTVTFSAAQRLYVSNALRIGFRF